MHQLNVLAPAKINLYLHVTSRREDGYHLLDSLVVFTDGLADRLTFTPGDGFSLSCEGPFSQWLAGGNLIERAAQAYYEASGIAPGCHVHLEKNIPVGAGLGGGSADAAAAIRGLEKFHGTPIQAARRAALLLKLGADVPACDHGKPCRFQGVGEIITDTAPLPAVPALLIWPGVPLATHNVFAARRGPFDPPVALPESIKDYGFLNGTVNGLAPAAEKLCPAIGEALHFLGAQPGCTLARMSGSGSCVFGLFETMEQRAAAKSIGASRHPAWWFADVLL